VRGVWLRPRAPSRSGLVREADRRLRGERSQETDGREAGTSAVRSSGTIV
jgi:hypothetical protein